MFRCFPISKVRVNHNYSSLTNENDIMLVQFDGEYLGAPIALNNVRTAAVISSKGAHAADTRAAFWFLPAVVPVIFV